ncbi:DUF1116 domain-containing protein [Candidatus Calescamantes bacterium]|nr:DUF1116 domain-containing protein [Candidatus Calescamantes bacterium]
MMDFKKINEEAFKKILAAEPVIAGLDMAKNVIPDLDDSTFLHAGPPVTWEKMCGPMKGGMIGGMLYEGLASTEKEAVEKLSSGAINFDPCHHHSTVGPMAGVVTPNMPVWIIENKTYGNKAYCTLNEGLGKVLRYGAFAPEVIERLNWMRDILYPVLKMIFEKCDPLYMKPIIAQALQMGDEGHNRNRAGTSLFLRIIGPYLIEADIPNKDKVDVFKFIDANDHFFLNLTMPAAKCTTEAIEGIEGCSIVTVMARNGTDLGIRVAGLPGEWFTGPAQDVDGLYLPGFSEEDANPDIGDSTITETGGIGAFAMAAAPAIIGFVGGTVQDAIDYTLKMYEISVGENDIFKIPALDFRGTPTGIDIVKVVESGILPRINTGIAHKDPGVGQIGAGLTFPPKNVFSDALKRFGERYL